MGKKRKRGPGRKTFKEIRAASWPATETDLNAVIAQWMREQGWEVFQEVQVFSGGPVADLVGRKDGLLWIVEGKRRLNLTLLSQAARWLGWAHYVSVALPNDQTCGSFELAFAQQVCEERGIGWLRAWGNGTVRSKAGKLMEGKLSEDLNKALCEEHKHVAQSGTNRGGYHTPFKRTVQNLVAYVKQNRGSLLREAVLGIDHHYRTTKSACSALQKLIDKEVIEGLELRRAGRSWRLYATERA